LKRLKFNQAVVFVNSIKSSSDLQNDLKIEGYAVIEIHESIAPEERFVYFY
jgi:superfamily II DNA/RNA helicase